MPPLGLAALGRECRLATFTPETMTRLSFGRTFKTSPCLPLSRPVITTTRSPFLIFSFADISNTLRPRLEHFRREADDLHELLGPQLARHGAEDAGADRLALLVDQDRRVAVEADRAAVVSADFPRGADDHRLVHVAFLHAAPRNRFLDGHDDHVADGGEAALGPAQHLDALHPARAGIVGDLEVRLHLD